MSKHGVRAAVVAAAVALMTGVPAGVSAQHEHHGGGGGSAAAVVGTVLCVEGVPLTGVVVQVFHVAGTERHPMGSTLTDAAGRFAVRVPAGTYVLEASYIGHRPEQRPLVVAAGATSHTTGVIRLEISALHLDALAVSAERERVRMEGGATVVEVAGAAAAAGGSVADLLRTVPGLEVDAEGRITMRGSTSVLVLLNGRRITLTGDALAAFLKQLPASALTRVEAGTTASAKQDSDGAAGVVNLVLASGSGAADMRSLTVSAGAEDHYSAALAAAGSPGRWAWDAAYALSSMRPVTEQSTTRESLLPADPVQLLVQNSRARARHRLHTVVAGGSARVSDQLSLSTRGTWAWMEGVFGNTTAFRNVAPSGAASFMETRSSLAHTIPSGSGALGVEWAGGGARAAHASVDVQGSLVREHFTGDYFDDAARLFLATTMKSRQEERVVRSDVAFNVGAARLELGQQTQLRDIVADYATVHTEHVTQATMRAAHRFDYGSDVHAGYVSLHGGAGPVQAQAGLRLEADRTTSAATGEEEIRRRDVRLFPTAVVSWPRDEASAVRFRLSAARRIHRPEAALLNPYSMGEDDMNAVVGNPALRPEITDQLEAGVEHRGGRITWHASPFVRWTSDPIRPIKAVTASGRSTTSLHNLERTRAAGVEASVRTRPAERLSLLLAGSTWHMRTEGLAYRSSGVHASARVTADLRVADRTLLQLYAYRRGAEAVEQGEILPITTTQLAVVQTFGRDERGRLTLRVNDPFAGDRVAFRIGDQYFTQRSSRRVSQPVLALTFSWSIGGAHADAAAPPAERRPQIF